MLEKSRILHTMDTAQALNTLKLDIIANVTAMQSLPDVKEVANLLGLYKSPSEFVTKRMGLSDEEREAVLAGMAEVENGQFYTMEETMQYLADMTKGCMR